MAMAVDLLVEVPKGERNKYEWDHRHGRIRLDRRLAGSVHFPGDYGFVLDTWAEDGDPLDALLVLSEPTFPGCLVSARVVGCFYMEDGGVPDNKIVAVPAFDPARDHVRELANVPPHLLDEMSSFFATYKDLEEGQRTEVWGFGTRQEAEELIEQDRQRYAQLRERPRMP